MIKIDQNDQKSEKGLPVEGISVFYQCVRMNVHVAKLNIKMVFGIFKTSHFIS
jgi:hypothetical protein